MVSPLCALEVQKQKKKPKTNKPNLKKAFQTAGLFLVKNLNGKREKPDTYSRSPAIWSPDLRWTSQESQRAVTGSYRSAAAETSPSQSPLRTSSEKGEVSPLSRRASHKTN